MTDLLRRIDIWAGRAGRMGMVAVVLAAALVALLPFFASLPPVDRDEARFAQASKQMLMSGDYVDIRFQDEPRHKKPAGIYWLQSAAVALTGDPGETTIWKYRLPSLIAALLSALLTARIAQTFAGRREAIFAGILMAGVFMLSAEAKLAKTDAVLLLTVLAAQSVIARLWRDVAEGRTPTRISAWETLLFWGGLGAGILVKGPIGVMVAGLTVLVLSALRRDVRWLAALRPGIGVALMLAIALPWYVLITLRSDGGFWAESVGKDLLSKAASAQESHGAPPGAYLAAMWLTFFPASVALVLGAPWIWRMRRSAGIVFAAAWVIPTWVVFEALPTKLVHYVLPAYPGIVLAVALAWHDTVRHVVGRWRIGLAVLASLIPIVALGAAGLFLSKLGPVPVLPLALGTAAIVTGLMLMLLAMRADLPVLSLAALLLAGTGFSAGFFGAASRADALWPAVGLSRLVAAPQGCASLTVYEAAFAEPSFIFLTKGRVVHGDLPSVIAALSADRCAFGVLNAADASDRFDTVGSVRGMNLGTGKPVDLVVVRAKADG